MWCQRLPCTFSLIQPPPHSLPPCSAQNTDLDVVDLPAYPEARTCYSNRDLDIQAVALGAPNTVINGGADSCNFMCQQVTGCVGFTYAFLDLATGEGNCQLYSDLGRAERAITGGINIYVANTGSNACPPLAPAL